MALLPRLQGPKFAALPLSTPLLVQSVNEHQCLAHVHQERCSGLQRFPPKMVARGGTSRIPGRRRANDNANGFVHDCRSHIGLLVCQAAMQRCQRNHNSLSLWEVSLNVRCSAARSEELVAHLIQKGQILKYRRLVLLWPQRQQESARLKGDLDATCNHGLQECLMCIVSETSHLASALHLNSNTRVCSAKAHEREDWSLASYEVKLVDMNFHRLHFLAQHDPCG
mmetsp:Transcript_31905/g.60026  ORF Transcript_31905/g.60026 Transcript_31905/m.60026 type:complete len:225 (-) Transcript_31905:133-807(-)